MGSNKKEREGHITIKRPQEGKKDRFRIATPTGTAERKIRVPATGSLPRTPKKQSYQEK